MVLDSLENVLIVVILITAIIFVLNCFKFLLKDKSVQQSQEALAILLAVDFRWFRLQVEFSAVTCYSRSQRYCRGDHFLVSWGTNCSANTMHAWVSNLLSIMSEIIPACFLKHVLNLVNLWHYIDIITHRHDNKS